MKTYSSGHPGHILSSGIILPINSVWDWRLPARCMLSTHYQKRRAIGRKWDLIIYSTTGEAVAMLLFGIGFGNLLRQSNLSKR